MNNKEKYIEFCKTEKGIPVFSRPWWLDSVCEEGKWDVALVDGSSGIIASLTYYMIKKSGFNIITMPPQTKFMGVYIKYPENQKHEKKLSYEKDIMNKLIEQLPKYDSFSQNFYYSITNWLPFYWKGFTQTTQYSYVIQDLTNLDSVFSNFNHSKRKNIKKAEKSLEVKFDLSPEDFYENHKMTLKKQNANISYTLEVFKNIYTNAYKHNSGRTIYAVDKDSNIHSALFVIWDEHRAYDLISTIDPDFRNSGSASLLVREIIKYISDKTDKFDFEGSMIENVENSFRQFGATQTPYFLISKVDSKILKTHNFIRELLK